MIESVLRAGHLMAAWCASTIKIGKLASPSTNAALTVLVIAPFLTVTLAYAFLNSIENRMTYPEFVEKELKGDLRALKQVSGAGKFSCNDTWESGALVARNDIVAMAAHSVAILKDGKCVLKPKLEKCYFQTIKSDASFGRKVLIDPKTLTVAPSYRCLASEFNADWAVAKLQFPVREATAFEIEEGDVPRNLYIYVFAAANANFSRPGTPTVCYGRMAYTWKFSKANGSADAFGINCSSSPGNSGGAAVYHDYVAGKWIYTGLISAGTSDEAGAKFDSDNFSAGPLFAGEILSCCRR